MKIRDEPTKGCPLVSFGRGPNKSSTKFNLMKYSNLTVVSVLAESFVETEYRRRYM